MPSQELSAIIFDLDDTLVDFGSKYDQRLRAVRLFEEKFRGLGLETVAGTLEDTASAFWKTNSALGPFAARYEGRREITRLAFKKLGLADLSQDEAFISTFTDRYVAERERAGTLRPGATQVIDQIRNAGLKLGLLTNGSNALQDAKVQRLKLAALFDVIQIEEAIGFGKPDNRAYHAIAHSLGTAPGRCCMIGDNYSLDIVGAKAAGMQTIFFAAEPDSLPKDHIADHVVADLRSVPAILGIVGS